MFDDVCDLHIGHTLIPEETPTCLTAFRITVWKVQKLWDILTTKFSERLRDQTSRIASEIRCNYRDDSDQEEFGLEMFEVGERVEENDNSFVCNSRDLARPVMDICLQEEVRGTWYDQSQKSSHLELWK